MRNYIKLKHNTWFGYNILSFSVLKNMLMLILWEIVYGNLEPDYSGGYNPPFFCTKEFEKNIEKV